MVRHTTFLLPTSYQAGFTFVELLLVMALVMVISISSTAFYARFFTQNAVSNADDQVATIIRKAQLYSMIGKQNGEWGITYINNTLVLFQGNSYASRNDVFDQTYSVPSSVTITGLNETVFNTPSGTPSGTLAISISGGSTVKSITMNSQGAVNR